MNGELALEAAYERCRRLHATHGRTYYLATSLLPRARRRHVWALYAFARVADELVDVPHPDPADLLGWADQALGMLYADHPPEPHDDPVLAATWHTLRECNLDPHLLEEFLTSMVMDLQVSRYATWAELRRYMRGSAAVIGELMTPLLGATDPAAIPLAGTLGEAFQLTNFIRDIGEDLGLGRIYLPLEDLRAHGVDERQLARAVRTGTPDRSVRRLVAFEVGRALGLYDAAYPGLAMVDARSRPCLQVAFVLYRRILHHIEANGFNVFQRRLRVPTAYRMGTVARAGAGVVVPQLAPTAACRPAVTGSAPAAPESPGGWGRPVR